MKASENLWPGRQNGPTRLASSFARRRSFLRSTEIPVAMEERRAQALQYPDSGLRTSPPPSQSYDQWLIGGLSPDTVALPSPILTEFPQNKLC